MRARLLLGCVLVAVAGCGTSKFVPVSGKVTLDGKPLAGATVSFEPVTEPGTTPLPPGSLGKTDQNGNFTLQATSGENGALVGKHRVVISLIGEQATGDERRRGGGVAEKLPRKYNADSELTFDVPPGGTSEAVFTLTSPPEKSPTGQTGTAK
jgi:hypothetical protein